MSPRQTSRIDSPGRFNSLDVSPIRGSFIAYEHASKHARSADRRERRRYSFHFRRERAESPPTPRLFDEIEARVLIMTKTPQEGDTPASWKVANSPGAPITCDQLPRNAGQVFDAGAETSHMVISLTNALKEEPFQAQPCGSFGEAHNNWSRW